MTAETSDPAPALAARYVHGDFVKWAKGGRPLVHIVKEARVPGTLAGFWTVCGKPMSFTNTVAASGDEPRQCAKCWESM